MGKGDKRRRCIVGRVEETLRWELYQGKITREEFDIAVREMKEGPDAKK